MNAGEESTRDLIDKICDAFEKTWQEGRPPRISTQLEELDTSHHEELLKNLVPLDQEYRKKHSLPCHLEIYVVELPAHAELISAILSASLSTGIADDHLETKPPKLSLTGKTETSNRIGPYKLLQKIGEGGMGEVWMAEQEKPVCRRVALKLIKTGSDNKQVIARFEAERQALAMMDHPNIAKVLDAGTTEVGNPFFVMELVHGISFNQYCDRNRLTPNERLKLFVPVCKAIQHAHQKGIIHRDLKPSNVLVQMNDGEPNAKVIDFGLAKALQHQTKLTDKTMFTEFGQVVGTLQYMSPEQATMDAMNVDTRTDIYSLGVMLYELLAGSTPIERETLQKKRASASSTSNS